MFIWEMRLGDDIIAPWNLVLIKGIEPNNHPSIRSYETLISSEGYPCCCSWRSMMIIKRQKINHQIWNSPLGMISHDFTIDSKIYMNQFATRFVPSKKGRVLCRTRRQVPRPK